MVVATVTCNKVSIGIFTIPGNHATGIRAKQFLLLVGGGNIHQCWWWEGFADPLPVRIVLSKPAIYPDLTTLL
jgi:hypothetical protein